MLMSNIFQIYVHIFLDILIIFLWGWCILFCLSRITKYQKMFWGILGATILCILSIAQFMISTPKLLFVLIPNISIANIVNQHISMYLQYLQPYYLYEIVVGFSCICLVAALTGRHKQEDSLLSAKESKQEKIEEPKFVSFTLPPKMTYTKDVISSQKPAPSAPVPHYEEPTVISDTIPLSNEVPKKIHKQYNTIDSVSLSPMRDTTINASAMVKQQEFMDKEERFKKFSYQDEDTIDKKYQEVQEKIAQANQEQIDKMEDFISCNAIVDYNVKSQETEQKKAKSVDESKHASVLDDEDYLGAGHIYTSEAKEIKVDETLDGAKEKNIVSRDDDTSDDFPLPTADEEESVSVPVAKKQEIEIDLYEEDESFETYLPAPEENINTYLNLPKEKKKQVIAPSVNPSPVAEKKERPLVGSLLTNPDGGHNLNNIRNI